MQAIVETFTGQRVNLMWPLPEHIKFRDIAHALSRIGRYNGHTSGEHVYTVAQHSVWVAMQVQRMGSSGDTVRQALLHDAHEAYMGDIVTPLKTLPWFNAYFTDVEDRLQCAILQALDVAMPGRAALALIKRADQIALAVESRHLVSSRGEDWGLETVSDEVMQTFIPALPAQKAFELYWLADKFARDNLPLEDLWEAAR